MSYLDSTKTFKGFVHTVCIGMYLCIGMYGYRCTFTVYNEIRSSPDYVLMFLHAFLFSHSQAHRAYGCLRLIIIIPIPCEILIILQPVRRIINIGIHQVPITHYWVVIAFVNV